MNDLVKARSLQILSELDGASDNVSWLAEEMVRMLIRGDDNSVLPPQTRQDVEQLREAAETIRACIINLSKYVNRKQPTHRL